MNLRKSKSVIVIFVFGIIICSILTFTAVTKLNETIISAISKNRTFVLGGDSVGIKILAEGVLVMKNEREDLDLKVGDVILKIDDKKINTSEALENYVKEKKGESVTLTVNRNKSTKVITVAPILDTLSNEYKLNIWVKDSSAGVGTITFYDKDNLEFAGLGHGVTETDENYIVPIETGAITFTDILSIKKGYPNEPGEISGTVTSDVIGSIALNTNRGIYGILFDSSYIKDKEEIELADKSKIKEGPALIYSSVNHGKKEYYEIEIQKVMLNSLGNKNMIIKVTDKKLLELTGGIIQGMSGSPIIQDGKLIGAVTHVLLNDPTIGYGVFIENMVEDMISIK